MIIGISGKIGSGKDLIGSIIQYLTDVKEGVNHKSYDEWLSKRYYKWSDWEIKKFAGKLKQIVSIITGISVEDLELQEVKDKVLGEEWWYYTNSLFYENKKNIPYSTASNKVKNNVSWYIIKPTIRQLLQEIGTNAMRNQIHPDIWVNALFADYKAINTQEMFDNLAPLYPTKSITTQVVKPMYPNWIITDVRFPNELQAVKDRGGIVIRVNREYKYGNLTKDGLTSTINQVFKTEHTSENALDNAEFNYVVDNNGTIEELIEKVKEILIKEGII